MTPEKIRAKSHVGAFGIHIYGLRLKSGCAKPYTPTWKGFCGKEIIPMPQTRLSHDVTEGDIGHSHFFDVADVPGGKTVLAEGEQFITNGYKSVPM